MSLKYPVTWRLRECMQAAKIDTVTELHNRIKAIAPDAIKYAQLARIVESPPARLNLQTLAVLTIVLGCRPGIGAGTLGSQHGHRQPGGGARLCPVRAYPP